MGNKTGKFDVQTTENNKKDEVCNDNGVKFDSSNTTEPNGDQVNQELNEAVKNDSEPLNKKKNITSWFKKLSMRKGSKAKESKDNGIKEENGKTQKENEVTEELTGEKVKENGINCDVQSEKVEVPQIQYEDQENVIEINGLSENKDEMVPIVKENDNNEVAETPIEVQ